MKQLLFAVVIVVALFVMGSSASAQCGYTTYYQPHVTYYASPAVVYPPVYSTYYSPRPYWSGYRYYSYSPGYFYFGW